MTRFTLKQLGYFAAAGEIGSVTGAAVRVHVSQASVSAAIAHLEAVFGVQLFIRHHAQGLSLTAAGRRLLAEARLLLAQAEGLQAMASDLGGGLTGRVEVGCFLTLAPIVMPGLIRDFAERHPGIEIACQEGDADQLHAALREGRVELALLYDLSPLEAVELEPLAALPPYAILAPDHPLAAAPRVSLQRLAAEPMVLLDLPYSRDYFSGIFRRLALEPRIAYRSHSPNMVQAMVANGLGYSLMNVRPRLDRALDGRRFVARDLEEPLEPLRLGLARLAGTRITRAAEAFADFCREVWSRERFPCMAAPVVAERDEAALELPEAL